jgi:Uma2 family endonuclease
MSVTAPPLQAESVEPKMVLEGVSWDAYAALCDSTMDRPNPRMIYCERRLVLMGKSRRHQWLAEILGDVVMGIATQLDIPCEPSGEATYRRREKDAGQEGDRTFHIGAHADLMRGDRNYDFENDPPPDLAIEVEVSHPADDAMKAWGRLAVPEVWRFHVKSFTCTFWLRRHDGSYEQIEQSLAFPMLRPSDVVEQLRVAQQVGTIPWLARLPAWVNDVIRPRLARKDGCAANGPTPS